MELRKVDVNDIELIIKLRMDYFAADNVIMSPEEKATIIAQLRDYLPKHIADGTFIGIVAEEAGEVLGVAFLALAEKPANPAFITGKTGTILNVLTFPQHRRQGIATKVICRIMDEAKRCGVSNLDLSATESGRPLYEKLGFYESKHTAMRLRI